MFRRGEDFVCARFVYIRMFEEPEAILGRENGPRRVIDGLDRDDPLANQRGKVLQVALAPHVHADSSIDRSCDGIADIAGKTVHDEALNRERIAHDNPWEFPTLPKDVVQKEAIRGGRNTVQV